MNPRKLLSFLAAFALAWLPAEKLSAQTVSEQDTIADESFQLVLNYGELNEASFSCHRGVVEPVGVNIDGLLPFTILVPTEKAGLPVRVGALDGGQINAITPNGEIPLTGDGAVPQDLVISGHGTIGFSFQAGSMAGSYRFLVSVGAEKYQLQLYVVDPNSPGRIPH